MIMETEKNALVIGGPTGVGESTVTKKIIEKYPNKFVRLVTATTRKPRPKEKNGVDYYFFTEKKFQEEIKNGNILEWQNTRKGVYYGTYKPELEKQLERGFKVIINPDIVGAKYFKKNFDAVTIFLMPESLDSLKKRMLDRNPDMPPQKIKERLEYAQYEMDNESDFYDYKVLNAYGKMDNAIKEITSILKKENCIS
jgi:guanylate kinase